MNPINDHCSQRVASRGRPRNLRARGDEETVDDRSGQAARVWEGDVASRNRVVQENLGLVIQVARQFVRRGLSLDDLIAEGNLGLIRAAELYDPGHGTRFSTYAVFFIREAIQSALAKMATTIRLPVNLSRLLERWRRTERKLWHDHGRPPTFEEVATTMGLDGAAQRLIEKAQRVAHIQQPQTAAWPVRWLDGRTFDGGGPPEESLVAVEEREWVSRRIERLGETERAVIVLRFGLAGESPKSLEQIRDRLGITKAAVEKLTSAAIRKLGRRSEACA
jgi:RNA polymerase primary sigma factor